MTNFAFNPFQTGGRGRGWLIGCLQSQELRADVSPSQVYPAGKLQGHILWIRF